jgi:hypothetical protein
MLHLLELFHHESLMTELSRQLVETIRHRRTADKGNSIVGTDLGTQPLPVGHADPWSPWWCPSQRWVKGVIPGSVVDRAPNDLASTYSKRWNGRAAENQRS